jgi:hypothetical protein
MFGASSCRESPKLDFIAEAKLRMHFVNSVTYIQDVVWLSQKPNSNKPRSSGRRGIEVLTWPPMSTNHVLVEECSQDPSPIPHPCCACINFIL